MTLQNHALPSGTSLKERIDQLDGMGIQCDLILFHPYGHLLSNHNCIGFWDFDNKDTTHVCLQIKGCEEVSGFIRKYRKPLMVDECCYEGIIAYEWGNISPFEMVNKFWMTIVQGGYCTHGETPLKVY